MFFIELLVKINQYIPTNSIKILRLSTVGVIYKVRYRINTGVLNSVRLLSGRYHYKGLSGKEINQGGARLVNLKRCGELLLSAYIMKKIKPGKSQKSGGLINKYGKLVLGAYLLEKLKSEKSEKEAVPKIETKEVKLKETGGGSTTMKISKVMIGVLVGVTAIYALKKYSAKKSGYNIKVQ